MNMEDKLKIFTDKVRFLIFRMRKPEVQKNGFAMIRLEGFGD